GAALGGSRDAPLPVPHGARPAARRAVGAPGPAAPPLPHAARPHRGVLSRAPLPSRRRRPILPPMLLQAAVSAVHPEPPPASASPAFVLLVAILAFGLSAWLRGSGGLSSGALNRVRIGVGAWLLLTGALAWRGALADFWAIPPRIVFAVAPAMLCILILAFRP